MADSKGKIRGDKAHDKLVALGYAVTDRTTRLALAEIKAQWRVGNVRLNHPWQSSIIRARRVAGGNPALRSSTAFFTVW